VREGHRAVVGALELEALVTRHRGPHRGVERVAGGLDVDEVEQRVGEVLPALHEPTVESRVDPGLAGGREVEAAVPGPTRQGLREGTHRGVIEELLPRAEYGDVAREALATPAARGGAAALGRREFVLRARALAAQHLDLVEVVGALQELVADLPGEALGGGVDPELVLRAAVVVAAPPGHAGEPPAGGVGLLAGRGHPQREREGAPEVCEVAPPAGHLGEGEDRLGEGRGAVAPQHREVRGGPVYPGEVPVPFDLDALDLHATPPCIGAPPVRRQNARTRADPTAAPRGATSTANVCARG
jgi:hypothetical protein